VDHRKDDSMNTAAAGLYVYCVTCSNLSSTKLMMMMLFLQYVPLIVVPTTINTVHLLPVPPHNAR